MSDKTRWAELFPDEFLERQAQQSIVYLPLGICEPHGNISTLGLDTFKADYLCDEAARRFGGIVAPTLAYQIHESGYHAPWLAEVVGERPALLTGIPPHVMLYFFLYQLRSFYNAGFKTAIVISGHAGGNQEDFRLAGNMFEQHAGMQVLVYADPELVMGHYAGDHAGKYEISQALYLRPDTVNLDAIARMNDADSLGRFGQGEDAAEASADMGHDIIERSLVFLGDIIASNPRTDQRAVRMLNYAEVERLYQRLIEQREDWITTKKNEGQTSCPTDSRWRPYEDAELPNHK